MDNGWKDDVDVDLKRFNYFQEKIPYVDDDQFKEVNDEWDLIDYPDNGKMRLNHSNIANYINEEICWTAVPSESKNFWVYYRPEGYWMLNGEAYLENIVEYLLGDLTSQHHTNEILGHLRRSNYIERTKPNSRYINVENGVIDLAEWDKDNSETRKDALIENKPFEYFKSVIPHEYKPDAEIDKIEDFMHQIVRDDDVPLIQEMFGYSLFRGYPISRAFMLVGDGGNGKSTLLNLLQKFLSEDSVSNISLHDLENNRFRGAELYGKLANIYADLPDRALNKSSMLKTLTGGDRISVERKNQDPFEFVNHAKLIFSANQMPKSSEMTEAIIRRWIIIEFPYDFENGDVEKDPNILEKITTEEEMSGLINWALEGLQRILEEDGFSHTDSREDRKNQLMKQSDPFRFYANKCFEYTKKRSDVLPKSKVNEIINEKVLEEGLVDEGYSQHYTTKNIKQIYPKLGEKQKTINNSNKRVFTNIRISEDCRDDQEDEEITNDSEDGKNDSDQKLDEFNKGDETEKGDEGLSQQQKVDRLLNYLPEAERIKKDKIVNDLDLSEEEVRSVIDLLAEQGEIINEDKFVMKV